MALFAQLPTIDEPQDSDAHFTPSRGVPSMTRNDTLRKYMAPQNLGPIALQPGIDFLPDSLRGNFFKAPDSLYYFVAYDRSYISAYDDTELRDSITALRGDIGTGGGGSIAKSVVFFGFGQSNMDGRESAGDTASDPLILRLSTGGTTPTATVTDNTPIFQAAKAYRRDNPLDTVYILKVASGGTSITEWGPGGSLRTSASSTIATHGGVKCDAVFWHQGEADRDNQNLNVGLYGEQADSNYYAYFYENVYPWLDSLFGDNTTRIVLGQVSDIETSTYYGLSRNDAINRIGRDSVANTSAVVSYNLETFDNLHFSGEAVDTLGQLYYEAWLNTPYYEVDVYRREVPIELPDPFFSLSAFRFPGRDLTQTADRTLTSWSNLGYTFTEQQSTGAAVGFRLLDFDGNQFMSSSQNGTIFDRDSTFTIAAVIEVGDAVTGEQVFYAADDANSRFGIAIRDNEVSVGMFDGSWSSASDSISLGQKLVVVGQCDGAGNIRTWVDGIEVSGVTRVYTLGGDTDRFFIGALASGTSNYTGGVGAIVAYRDELNLKQIQYLSDSLRAQYFVDPYSLEEATFGIDSLLDKDFSTLQLGNAPDNDLTLNVDGTIGVVNGNNVMSTTLTDYTTLSFDPSNYLLYFPNLNSSTRSYGIGWGTANNTQNLGASIAYRTTDVNNKGELAFYTKKGTGVSTSPTLSMLLGDDDGVYLSGFTPDNLPLGLSGGLGIYGTNFKSVSASNDATFDAINDLANWRIINDRTVTSSIAANNGALLFSEASTNWDALSFDFTAQRINLLGITNATGYNNAVDNILVATGTRGELGVTTVGALGDGNGILEDAGPHNLNDGTIIRGATQPSGSIGRFEIGNGVSAAGTSFNYLHMRGNNSKGVSLDAEITESTGAVSSASLTLSNDLDASEFTEDGDWTFTSAGSYRRGFDWTLNALLFSGSDYNLLPSTSPDHDRSYWVQNSDRTFTYIPEFVGVTTSDQTLTAGGSLASDGEITVSGVPAGTYEAEVILNYESSNINGELIWTFTTIGVDAARSTYRLPGQTNNISSDWTVTSNTAEITTTNQIHSTGAHMGTIVFTSTGTVTLRRRAGSTGNITLREGSRIVLKKLD